ncbi:MAG: lytic transglycosylase domain-containing protein, partial [Flavobacteriales bacterium]|nr:lytic transglycosylase domain-containing protein [Flavobacteriales bacterium]
MKNKIVLFGAVGLTLAFVGLRSAQSNEAPHPVEVRPSTVKPFPIPENLDFAGEALPLAEADVKEKLDREMLVNSYWQSNNLLMLKRSAKFFPIIEPILAKNGIPEDFKYLSLIESGLQNVVSPAGASGYWQIMKSTGLENGLEINKEVDERYHIEKSTQVACTYLNEAYERFGNWTLAAASYNMGMAGTARRLNEQGVDSYYDLLLNTETARY